MEKEAVGEADVESQSPGQEEYDPKGHKHEDLRLTCCERFIIFIGAMFVVVLMILVHHPEIYTPESALLSATAARGQGATTTAGDMLWTGWATPAGTAAYASTKNGYQAAYRVDAVSGATLSSVGLGTYLGDATDEVDLAMEEAVYYTVSKGVNVIDSAINYRGQRSERAVRLALRKLFGAGTVNREDVFVSTKAGFIPGDSQKRLSPQKTVASWATTTKDFPSDEVVEGKHCIAPACLNSSLHASRNNLGLYTIDLVYLHNSAEKQLDTVERGAFLARLKAAFVFLEAQRALNYLRYYGLATWTCFTADPAAPTYLSLAEVVALAEAAGGPNHGFRYVQLPVTLTLPAAATETYQEHGGRKMNVLDAATSLNVTVMSSRSVGAARFDALAAMEKAYAECTKTSGEAGSAGQLGHDYDAMLRASTEHGSGSAKHKEAGMLPLPAAALSLLVTRSVPGVTTALVGMTDPKHIKENLHTLKFEGMPPAVVACMLAHGQGKPARGLFQGGSKGAKAGKGRAKPKAKGDRHQHKKLELGSADGEAGEKTAEEGDGGADKRRGRRKKGGRKREEPAA